jgi:hypothetical protein
MRSLFVVFLLFLVAMPVAAAPARAQDNPLEMLLNEFLRRQDQVSPADEVPAVVKPKPKRPRKPKPAVVAIPDDLRPPPPGMPVPVGPSQFVFVLGDSLAELLADGLTQEFATRADIAVKTRTKGSSGFVRDDFYDWNVAIKDLIGSGERIDAVVMMIGANDRQQLRDENGSYDTRAEAWRNIYTRRIDSALAQFKARDIPVVWVGLPSMKNERLNNDVVYFNEIYRDRTERIGGAYIDIWNSFVDESGRYAAYGPDLNGMPAKLRAGDGVHFTKAGAQLAAHYVVRGLQGILGEAPRPGRSTAPATSATDPQLFPRSAVSGVSVMVVMPEALTTALGLPVEPPEPPRPLFGPVLPLEAIERATGASLLGEIGPQTVAASAPGGPVTMPTTPSPIASADPSVEKLLVRGEALRPKPGRVDDFTWPRPKTSPALTSRAPSTAIVQ